MNLQEQNSHKFKLGSLVSLKSNPDIKLPILQIIEGLQETVYIVYKDNQKIEYFESQLLDEDKKESKSSIINIHDLRASISSYKIMSPSLTNLFSLKSGKIEFVPYQYRPILKLLRSDTNRLLIADEVGVGKTIETGLIIKELQARLGIESILVICPKPLVSEKKWFDEMKRFDEQFIAVDGTSLKHCINETHLEGDWPDNFKKCIIPFSLFDSDTLYGTSKKHKHKQLGLINLDPAPKFDLVIVDEAHHARNSDTYIHQAVRYFCDNASAVIFLTATPIQLGNKDLFTLLNLMRPDLIIDKPSFEQMAEPNVFINNAIKKCRENKKDWSKLALKELQKCKATEWGRVFLCNSTDYINISNNLTLEIQKDENRLKLIRDLEGIYTFSNLINRTRRRDIGNFCLRKPKTISVNFTDNQMLLHDSLLNVISKSFSKTYKNTNPKFMMTTIQRQAASCLYGLKPLLNSMLGKKLNDLNFVEIFNDTDLSEDASFEEIQEEIELILKNTRNLDDNDPKLEKLKEVLLDKKTHEKNKVLLFSTFIHTLEYLFKHLSAIGLRVGLIHGSVKDTDRFTLRKKFALPKSSDDAFDVLLSSEVGCEGLDFQFCDFLINYDIPWNPMRIEQRIGRIDRYGQMSETVGILNFITPGTIDADIYNRCLLRIGIFEESIGAGEEILGSIAKEIKDIAESFQLNQNDRKIKLQQLSDNSIRDLQEQKELEKRDAELFGLNLPSENWKNDLKDAETFWLSPLSLQHIVITYLKKKLNSDNESIVGKKDQKNLRISKENRNILYQDFKLLKHNNDLNYKKWEKWLRGEETNFPITFINETTDPKENITYLNVLHPLLRQAAQNLKFEKSVYINITINDNKIPKGFHKFALYSWNKVGLKTDWELIPVCDNETIEECLLSLIEKAFDHKTFKNSINEDFSNIKKKHYSMWNKNKKEFQMFNKSLLEQKRQSLKISFKIRKEMFEKQITNQADVKILAMRKSELNRCIEDYENKISYLDDLANKVDIHTSSLVFGTINCI